MATLQEQAEREREAQRVRSACQDYVMAIIARESSNKR